MSMRGVKPKPARLRLLEGNPGRRPIRPEVTPPAGETTCPEHLDAVAQAEWQRLAPGMAERGVLTPWDRAALAAYCASWSLWIDAAAKVAALGAVVKAPKTGVPMQNPYLSIANGAQDRMAKLAGELGLTPVSRTRLAVEPAKPKDKLSRFIGGA
jgi:P27 family predicted phage terminase small subunit